MFGYDTGFYSPLCSCLTRMLSSSDKAIIHFDRYDMYAGDKSDAGVGSGRLGRLLWSYGFRFSVSTWNLFEVAVRIQTYIS
jgi:hypothetical protein